ncbi:MAG: CopG family transcriptional regulator [Candidatus Parabeggiatoa sp. nov. 3]|nr:MAG: CopG family transcriptional regulator [Gammaproteobacteria bacterium]RKZ60634.1 MAG: CopG family transcriptional regulator [Gammaproteobacteria bacterium]RKZ83243.1 MAG: CopG family transcriptional regulator [Gammaproteobacteria bacterium]
MEDVLFLEKICNKQEDNETGLHLQPTITAHRKLEAEMIAALKQDAEDQVYQAEIMAWDSVVGDGINAKE